MIAPGASLTLSMVLSEELGTVKSCCGDAYNRGGDAERVHRKSWESLKEENKLVLDQGEEIIHDEKCNKLFLVGGRLCFS